MIELVEHLLKPIVSHPDAVSVQVVEGDAVTILEIVVHPDDRPIFDADDGRTLRAVRNIVSAAAGRRKATVDIVEAHGEVASEE
jgi:predicted RNA-binding protein YlqC (UPF0109 family)